jgi:hypothetical protein
MITDKSTAISNTANFNSDFDTNGALKRSLTLSGLSNRNEHPNLRIRATIV